MALLLAVAITLQSGRQYTYPCKIAVCRKGKVINAEMGYAFIPVSNGPMATHNEPGEWRTSSIVALRLAPNNHVAYAEIHGMKTIVVSVSISESDDMKLCATSTCSSQSGEDRKHWLVSKEDTGAAFPENCIST